MEKKDAVQFAIDNNRLEGFETDQEAIEIFNQWADNKISFQELEQAIYRLCGIKI